MKKGLIAVFLAIQVLFGNAAYATEEQAPQESKETKENTATKAAEEKKAAPIAPVTKLDEVVVTATRTEKSLENVPGDVHVVTKEQIEKRNIKTIDEALDTTAGVFDRRGKGFMDTQANIAIRGVPAANRSLILIDGIPRNDAYTGSVSWTGPVGSVERLEVVEGPFSSLYGGNAMGGVVNIITKMPEKREVTLTTGYGSSWDRGKSMDDLWKGYLSYGDKIFDKLSFFAAYGYESTNGYATNLVTASSCPAGTTGCTGTTDTTGKIHKYILGNTGDNRWWDDSITAKAAYDFSKVTKLTVSFGRTRSEYNYDTPNTYLKNAAGQPVYLPNQYSFLSGNGGTEINSYAVSFDTEISSAKVKFNFGVNDMNKNWYTTPGSTGATTIGGGPGSLSSTPAQTYYSDLQATFPVFTWNILTLGTAFKFDTAHNRTYNLTSWKDETTQTNMTYEAKGTEDMYSVFLQDEISILNNLTAYLGVRGDYWTTQDGYANQVGAVGYPQSYNSRSDTGVSPKLSFVYKPFDLTTVRTSVGNAFRPPTVYELYRTWTSTTGTTYNSNPALTPETVTTWDFSVEQGLWKGAKVKGTYFENYFKDLIYLRTVSPTQQAYINAGKAETKGVVLEAEQKIYGFRLFANTTLLTESKIVSNSASPASVGKKLTYMPEHMYNAGAEYTYGPVMTSLTGIYVSKRYSTDGNTDTVNNVYGSYDPYFLLNGKITYKIIKEAAISFSVDNILNRKYFSYYTCPGRSWFTELTIKF